MHTPQFEVKHHTGTLSHAVPGQALLAIDTSLGTTVAVSKESEALEFISLNQRAHAEHVGVLIDTALKAANLTAAEITGVVMGIGPGSFTGLRVGMAAATGFAAGREIAVLPLNSHMVSAYEHELLQAALADPHTAVRIVQDARRRELFVTDFELVTAQKISKGKMAATAAAALFGLIDPSAGSDNLAHPPISAAGSQVVPRAGYESAEHEIWSESVSGIAMLRLATMQLAYGYDFAKPEPLYLRDPDVKPPARPLS